MSSLRTKLAFRNSACEMSRKSLQILISLAALTLTIIAAPLYLRSAVSSGNTEFVRQAGSQDMIVSAKSSGQLLSMISLEQGTTGKPAVDLPLSINPNEACPGFYIADVALAPGAKAGIWGIEILLTSGKRELSGGLNLGGAVDANGQNAAWGAFNIANSTQQPQEARIRLDAQALATPGYNPSDLGLRIRILDANKVPVDQGISGAPPLQMTRTLKPGFYIIEVTTLTASPQATFQLAAETSFVGQAGGGFQGGANVGGYLGFDAFGQSLHGFAAFCISEAQTVQFRTYNSMDYGTEGAGNLLLTIYDSKRNIIWQYAGGLYTVDPIVGNLRFVPSGSFIQGSPPLEACRDTDETQFTHTLTKNMAVMETAVTRKMWDDLRAVQNSLPADPTCLSFSSGLSDPAQCVSWYEAVLYANLLSMQRGLTPAYQIGSASGLVLNASNYQTDNVFVNWSANGYRLPTEGEREYFTRAGTMGPFSIVEPSYNSGNCTSCGAWTLAALESLAWFCANSNSITHPAGSKAANPWGLKDVHGNVWEWCWDWYGKYPVGAKIDYVGPSSGLLRVARGGGWGEYPRYLRSALRYYFGAPGYHIEAYGFRLLRPLN